MRKCLRIRRGGRFRMRVLCVLSMDSGIHCPRDDVCVTRKRRWKIARAPYPRRVRGGEARRCTFIDSDEIELREGVRRLNRAVLCKRFEIRRRQVEINREIGAVLIKPELNGIFPIPPHLIELAEQQQRESLCYRHRCNSLGMVKMRFYPGRIFFHEAFQLSRERPVAVGLLFGSDVLLLVGEP